MRAVIHSLDCMSAIFDNLQSVLLRKRKDLRHLTRTPREVHRQQRFRSRTNFLADFLGVDVQRFGIDIRQNGSSSRMDDRIYRSAKCQGCCDNFIAGLQLQRQTTQVKSRSTRTDSNRVLDAFVLAYEFLKLRYFRTRSGPGGSQAVHHFSNFGFFNQGLTKNEKVFTHRRNLCSHITRRRVVLRQVVPRQGGLPPLESSPAVANAVRMQRVSIKGRSATQEGVQRRFDTSLAETKAASQP